MSSAAPQHKRSGTSSHLDGQVVRARRGLASIGRPGGGPSSGPDRSEIMRRDATFRRSLVAADCASALSTLVLLFVIFAAGPRVFPPSSLILVVPVVMVAKLLGLYDRDELLLRKSTLEESAGVFQLATLYTLLVALLDRQLWGVQLMPRALLELWLLMFCLTMSCRWFARHLAVRLVPAERCLLVGDARHMASIANRLPLGRAVNATLVGELAIRTGHDNSQLMRMLERHVREDNVHRVILAPELSDSELVLDVVRAVKDLGVKVSLLPRLFEVIGSSVVFDDIAGMTVLGVRQFGLTRSSAAIKRTMDIAGAAAGLLATAPIMAAIAIAIRLDSPGPVFFRQTRVGPGGKRFEMLKFRSMVVGADAMRPQLVEREGADGDLFKLSEDPRLTGVGRWLRSSSLDELPQLINVLRGDMSLVGPRPLIVPEDALVRGWQRSRLHLTPGMTGPWQILGSTRVPLAEMVKMDYVYIANWSLLGDIKIILRTVLHVLGRSGL